MTPCTRDCKWRNRSDNHFFKAYSCNYLFLTGQSRVKVAYKLTGDKTLTKRVLRLLEPCNCPCYEQDEREKHRKGQLPECWSRTYDEAKLRQLHALGYNDGELARAFNVSAPMARKWRVKLGLPVNRTNSRRQIDWSLARKMVREGLTDREIAESLGCAPRTVRGWRARVGIYGNRRRVRHG